MYVQFQYHIGYHLEIQLTAANRVQWKQNGIERNVQMCDSSRSICILWKSYCQGTAFWNHSKTWKHFPLYIVSTDMHSQLDTSTLIQCRLTSCEIQHSYTHAISLFTNEGGPAILLVADVIHWHRSGPVNITDWYEHSQSLHHTHMNKETAFLLEVQPLTVYMLLYYLQNQIIICVEF